MDCTFKYSTKITARLCLQGVRDEMHQGMADFATDGGNTQACDHRSGVSTLKGNFTLLSLCWLHSLSLFITFTRHRPSSLPAPAEMTHKSCPHWSIGEKSTPSCNIVFVHERRKKGHCWFVKPFQPTQQFFPSSLLSSCMSL